MKEELSVIDLLALLEVFNEYDEFNEEYEKLVNGKDRIEVLYKLRRLQNKETFFCSKSIKDFYKKHEQTITKISRHQNIQSFMYHSYQWDKNRRIYQYIKENIDELDKMKELISKIHELGIEKIQLDEQCDFTKKIYSMWTWNNCNTYIQYLDDIEAIPGYQQDKIYYQTISSPYEIKIETFLGKLREINNVIKVNSLTFDKNILPNKISKEEIVEPIFLAQSEVKEDSLAIKNIIDLKELEKTLTSKMQRLEEILISIESTSNKETIKNTLVEIKEQLENIKKIIEQYENETIEKSTYVTSEVLEKEYRAYERRKRDSEMHIW